MKLSEELIYRGFSAETTIENPADLDNRKSKKFYWGADPSADSLTIGNLAALMMCACFVRHGYQPYLLVGGATGQIGDPKDNGERDLKPLEEVEHNKQCIKAQIERVINGAGDTAGGSPIELDENGGKAVAGPVQKIKVMGGEYWDNVVAYACEKGLTGIEALSKIPGLTGSAPVQNIGAYGQQLSDTLESVDVYDTATRTFRTLTKENMHFSYRQSIFNTTERGRYFIISITLKLKPGQMSRPFYNSLERYIDDHDITDFSPLSIRQIVSAIRDSKLPDPLKVASAGSFFHNVYVSDEEAEKVIEKGYPMHRGKDGNKINAAWLIEQCGFKGKLLHGIRVSDKAPLVLINESAKSYNDLQKAREEIVGHVYDKFGWWLEQEPVELQ